MDCADAFFVVVVVVVDDLFHSSVEDIIHIDNDIIRPIQLVLQLSEKRFQMYTINFATLP